METPLNNDEKPKEIRIEYDDKVYILNLEEWHKQEEFRRKKEAELFPEWLRKFLSK